MNSAFSIAAHVKESQVVGVPSTLGRYEE
jgi:hypothetical protein